MRLIDADKLAKEVTGAFYDVQIGRSLDELALEAITVVHKGVQDWIADADTVDVNDLEIVQDLRKRLKSTEEISAKAISMLSRTEMEKEAALDALDKLRREYGRYRKRGLISRILNEEV